MRIWMMPLVALVMIIGSSACDKAELTGAKAEVKKTDVKLDLPPVPKFDIPTSGGDTRGVREMRVMGRKLLDTKVSVKGYITWKYDCLVAGGPQGPIGGPDATPEERQKLIDDDPMLCWRPHFYLGDTPDTPPHQSLWVVEVARAMRPDELKSWKKLPDEMKADNPLPIVVEHAVGDQVVVTGKWSRTSPKGFANSDGLLVYESMENLSNPQEPVQQKP